MIEAVIFDMDGVLVDSYEPHLESLSVTHKFRRIRCHCRHILQTLARAKSHVEVEREVHS